MIDRFGDMPTAQEMHLRMFDRIDETEGLTSLGSTLTRLGYTTCDMQQYTVEKAGAVQAHAGISLRALERVGDMMTQACWRTPQSSIRAQH